MNNTEIINYLKSLKRFDLEDVSTRNEYYARYDIVEAGGYGDWVQYADIDNLIKLLERN